MARMLPPTPSATTNSEAELHLFRRFKEECPADWTVLHSLGLRRHGRKPWAEADFVVINSWGLMLVEVKGGAVRREGREWFTNASKLDESPFDQVNGAMTALSNDLRPSIRELSDGLVMSAVAFPDVDFTADGPDIVPEIVYDADDRERPVTDWLERAFEYWRDKIGGNRRRRGLASGARTKIIDRLAADFDLRPSLRARLGEINHELVRLTEQQASVMSALAVNPRIIVTGGAGTGKTWLAIEEALRVARDGGTALLMCHTKSLAGWMRDRLEGVSGVDVFHYNGLTTQLIRDAGLQARLSKAGGDQLFLVEHPELALEALYELDAPPSYDAVIVDEAQDFLNVPAVEFIDGLLRSNLEGGTWRFFLDPRQDVLRGLDVAAMAELGRHQPTRFPLTVNCRNTLEIATQTAVLSGRSLGEALPVTGPDPVYLRFTDAQDLRKQVSRQVKAWLDDGVQPRDIAIIGMRSLGHTALAEGFSPGVSAQLEETIKPAGARTIRYSTIASFKGLEADAVLLLDVGRLPPGPDACVDIYVGMSRARALLAVGVDARYDDERMNLYAAFGARMGSVSPVA